MQAPRSVGVVGLGAMGEPMARHLHRAGRLAAVANRSPARAHRLAAELGVPAMEDLAALAAACDAVLLCVSADGDVLNVVRALRPGLAPGSVVIDTSTVAPATARSAAALLAEHGIAFVDAPVTGGVEGARAASLSVLVGGEAAQVERVRPILSCIGARVAHLGGVGAGQAAKAVNQVMVAGIAEAVCEALALAERLGLDGDLLVDTLGNGAAGSWFLDKRGHSMLADRFDIGFKLSLLHKDLGIVQAIAREQGLHLPTVAAAIDDYAALLAEGLGDADISALIRRKRERIAVRA